MAPATNAQHASDRLLHFLAMISHEIRTPLGGILGLISALSVEEDATRRADMLKLAQVNGEYLRLMLDDLVDLARLRRDDFSLAPQQFDLVALLRETLDFWAVIGVGQGVGLSLTCAEAQILLLADRLRVRQILDNLLSNAIKYADGALVRLGLTLDDGALRLDVINAGAKLDPRAAELLFQDFVRLPDAAHIQPGAGLGLAISRQLAQLMGGDLGFEAVEAGNCFWLRLPRHPQQLVSHDRDASTTVPLRALGLNVLLVDDVATNRLVVRHCLQHMGCAVVEAQNGEEALELLCQNSVDIVLLDQFLPRMDGLETARQIRQLDGPKGQVPIIGISAYQRASDLSEMRRAGMTAFAPKPVTAASLAFAIAKARSTSVPIVEHQD